MSGEGHFQSPPPLEPNCDVPGCLYRWAPVNKPFGHCCGRDWMTWEGYVGHRRRHATADTSVPQVTP